MSQINALRNKYMYYCIRKRCNKHQNVYKQSKKITTEILVNFENNIAYMLLESSVTRIPNALLYLITKKKHSFLQ